MQDINNTPKLRFPGFTNPWEQRKLGDISESYSGGTPTADNKEYYNGDIPFIRSGEIGSDKTELFITEKGLKNSSAKMVKTGDILYALYGATSGEVSISKLKGAINQAILAIQPHEEYDSQFIMQWLRKSKEDIIGTYLQGGQGNLSGNIVKQLLIDVPTFEEQKEIGAYLYNLDNLITLHQRKCDDMIEYKKGLLQNLFPKEGETTPKIRFPGFTDKWETKRLIDCLNLDRKISKIGRASQSDTLKFKHIPAETLKSLLLDKGNVKLLSTGNFDGYTNEELAGEFLNSGEVIAIASGGSANLKYYNGLFVDSGNILASSRGNRDLRFIYYWLLSNFRMIKDSYYGGVIKHPDMASICNSIIKLPSLQEQQKIGSMLYSIDRQIEYLKQVIVQMKEYKKGLLQQMFV